MNFLVVNIFKAKNSLASIARYFMTEFVCFQEVIYSNRQIKFQQHFQKENKNLNRATFLHLVKKEKQAKKTLQKCFLNAFLNSNGPQSYCLTEIG